MHRPPTFDRYVVEPGLSRGYYVTDALAVECSANAVRSGSVPPPLADGAIEWHPRIDEAIADAARKNGR